MRSVLKTGLLSAVALALSQTLPVSLSAGIFCNHGLFGCRTCNPCQTCHVNPCRCQAAVPLPIQPQFTMTPQVQTTPVVTYRDVTRTEYRLQAQTVTVPVTTQQTVTVDEGGWQKVWVPNLVSRQIPATTYQQQTVYNQVPYQVSQRVPQISYQTTTRMVPQVNRQAAPGCNTCGTATAWNSHIHSQPMTSSPVVLGPVIGAPVAANPVIIGSPMAIPSSISSGPVQLGRELQPLNPVSSPYPASSPGPVPDPARLDSPQATNPNKWTPVHAAAPQAVAPQATFRPDPGHGVPEISSASGLFVPAPSAASVWRTRVR